MDRYFTKLTVLHFLALLLLQSCDMTESLLKDDDSDKISAEFIADSTLNVGADDTSATFNFTSNVSWSIKINDNWASVTPDRGDAGSITVSVELEANTSTQSRSTIATITAIDEKNYSFPFKIIQAGAKDKEQDEVIFSLDYPTDSLSSEAGVISISLKANSKWEVTDISKWLNISEKEGESNANLSLEYTKNETTSPRKGQVIITCDSVNYKMDFIQNGTLKSHISDSLSYNYKLNGDNQMLFKIGTQISIWAYDSNTAITRGEAVVYTYNGSNFTSNKPITFDNGNPTQKLTHYAVYPTQNNTTFIYSTPLDQTSEQTHIDSTLYSGTVTASNSRTPSLELYPRTAYLGLRILFEDVDSTNVQTTFKVKNRISCNLKSNSFTSIGESVTLTPNGNGTSYLRCCVAPQTITKGNEWATIVADGKSYVVKAENDFDITPQNNEVRIVTLKEDGSVSFGGIIDPWEDGGSFK